MVKRLTESEIEQLNPYSYNDFMSLLAIDMSDSWRIRNAVMEKIGNDYLPDNFVSEKYPKYDVLRIFENSISSTQEQEVVTALSWFPDIDLTSARTAALKCIHHSSEIVRAEAISTLGYCKDTSDVKMLLSMLIREISETLELEIYVALIRLGHSQVLDLFSERILLKSDDVLSDFIIGLSTLVNTHDFESIVPDLEKRLLTSNSKELKNEISDFFLFKRRKSILQEIKGLDITIRAHSDKLLNYFSDDDQHIRFEAISKFGGGQKPNKNIMPEYPPNEFVFDAVKNLMEDESDDVRAEALTVLGDWKRPADVKFCAAYLNDKSDIVRLDAIYALGEMGDKKALPYLLALENEGMCPLEKVRFFQTCIRLGRGEFFNEWISYLDHDDAMVRENVAGGVWSVLCDRWRDKIITALTSSMNAETFSISYLEMEEALEKTSA